MVSISPCTSVPPFTPEPFTHVVGPYRDGRLYPPKVVLSTLQSQSPPEGPTQTKVRTVSDSPWIVGYLSVFFYSGIKKDGG